MLTQGGRRKCTCHPRRIRVGRCGVWEAAGGEAVAGDTIAGRDTFLMPPRDRPPSPKVVCQNWYMCFSASPHRSITSTSLSSSAAVTSRRSGSELAW